MKATIQLFWKHRQLLPLLLLAVFSVSAIVTAVRGSVALNGVTYGLTLTSRHYAAFGAIIVNFVIYFRFRKLYGYSLALTLLAGLFSLFVFPYKNSAVGIETSWMRLMVQPLALVAGLLAGLLNVNRLVKTGKPGVT